MTRLRVPAPRERVYDALLDPELLAELWRGIRDVEVVARGRPDGVGRTVDLRVRAPLRRLDLRVTLCVTRTSAPERIVVRATGDIDGVGCWTLIGEGEGTRAEYTWAVTVRHATLRTLAPVLKPLFHAQHHLLMRRGAAALRAYLSRQADAAPRAA